MTHLFFLYVPANSYSNTEDKEHWARTVLGWETLLGTPAGMGWDIDAAGMVVCAGDCVRQSVT